jgi:phage terminase small subunit
MLEKKIRLIKAGQGDKAYYPKETLMRDGAKAFPKGTRLLNTHILANPNNSAYKQGVPASALVGTTREDARYEVDGLYAMAVIYSDYETTISEKSDAIGLSIFASARVEEVDGINTAVELIPSPFNSVDVVVHTKAGGAFVNESAEFSYEKLESVSVEIETGKKTIKKETGATMTVEELQNKLQQESDAKKLVEARLSQLQDEVNAKDKLLVEFQIKTKISESLAAIEFVSQESKTLVETTVLLQSLQDGVFDETKIDARLSNYKNGKSELLKPKTPEVVWRNGDNYSAESHTRYPITDNPAEISNSSLENFVSGEFKF